MENWLEQLKLQECFPNHKLDNRVMACNDRQRIRMVALGRKPNLGQQRWYPPHAPVEMDPNLPLVPSRLHVVSSEHF